MLILSAFTRNENLNFHDYPLMSAILTVVFDAAICYMKISIDLVYKFMSKAKELKCKNYINFSIC